MNDPDSVTFLMFLAYFCAVLGLIGLALYAHHRVTRDRPMATRHRKGWPRMGEQHRSYFQSGRQIRS